MRSPHAALIAAFLFLALSLSACLDLSKDAHERDPLAGGVLLDGGKPCPEDLVVNCSEANVDPQEPWVLRTLTLTRIPYQRMGDPWPTTGLTIIGMERGVIVDGFDIQGFEYGVDVNDTRCDDCTIDFRNGVIGLPGPDNDPGDFPPITCPLMQSRTGMRFGTADGRLSAQIHDVEFILEGGGMVCRTGSMTLNTGGSGVLRGPAMDLDLSNITARAKNPTSATAILWGDWYTKDQAASVQMNDVTLEGFHKGIRVSDSSSLTMQDVRITCGSPPFVTDGPDIYTQGPSAVTGIRTQSTTSIALEDLMITRCQHGIFIESEHVDSISVSRFEVSDADYGVLIDSFWDFERLETFPIPVRLNDGVVQDSRFLGVYVDVSLSEVVVENLRLTGNGWDWENAIDGRYGPYYGGMSITSSLTRVPPLVIGSSFEGNSPYGLTSFPFDSPVSDWPVQAQGNWWGHQDGPRVILTDQGVPVPASGSGDAVNEGVLFAPWAEEPLHH
jgi:hypothetical protein